MTYNVKFWLFLLYFRLFSIQIILNFGQGRELSRLTEKYTLVLPESAFPKISSQLWFSWARTWGTFEVRCKHSCFPTLTWNKAVSSKFWFYILGKKQFSLFDFDWFLKFVKFDVKKGTTKYFVEKLLQLLFGCCKF